MAFLDPLDEEETADYSDWRSIPDPPASAPTNNSAPTSATAADDPAVEDGGEGGARPEEEAPTEEAMAEGARRNRKRPPAFRDVTNRQDGGRDKKRAATVNNDSAESADDNSADPSAAATANPSDPFAFEAANNSAAAAAELWGGHGGERRRKKRRRQRRSLVIPPELSPPLEEGGGATNGPVGPSIAIGGGEGAEGAENVDGVDKETLLQLVRAYTALPPDLRAASASASQIESLASYPLPGKRRPVLGNSSSREEFLRRVQPIVMEMERRKKIDAEEALAATHCEVKKNGRAGYFYYDVESGERVGAEEYARRYHAMVAGRRRERIDRLGKETGKGELSDEGDATEEASGIDAANESNGIEGNEGSVEAKPSAMSDGSSMDMDESVNMDESRMSLDESAVREEEETHASVVTASAHVPSVEEAREEAREAEDREADNGPDEPQGEVPNNGPELERSQSAPGAHPPLAGMPPSDDPRVAAARERLRRALDAALADYSREILAIEAADRAKLKQV